MHKIVTATLVGVLLLAACGGDEPSPDEQACAASENLTRAMETDADAVDGAIDDLIAAAAAADNPAIRDAGDRLAAEAARSAGADRFGSVWAEITTICEDDE